MLLNSSLASGLGRPDLAYRFQSQTGAAVLTPPTSGWMSAGSEASTDFGDVLEERVTVGLLLILVLGLAGTGYWVRHHLA